LRHRLLRAAWSVTWFVLAAWTPPQLNVWRRLLLSAFGAKMGERSDVKGSARVWYPPNLVMGRRTILADRVNCYNMAPIVVEEGAVVSQGAHLCAGAHNIDDSAFALVTRPITIGQDSWVAAEAFVGPGVTVGEGAVLGARAVAFRDLAPWTVYVGNPAKPLRARKRPAAESRNAP
jgi:putative colanic acid biosynthesis acetyltransferase WcaF